jgi:hypothetical protein
VLADVNEVYDPDGHGLYVELERVIYLPSYKGIPMPLLLKGGQLKNALVPMLVTELGIPT